MLWAQLGLDQQIEVDAERRDQGHLRHTAVSAMFTDLTPVARLLAPMSINAAAPAAPPRCDLMLAPRVVDESSSWPKRAAALCPTTALLAAIED